MNKLIKLLGVAALAILGVHNHSLLVAGLAWLVMEPCAFYGAYSISETPFSVVFGEMGGSGLIGGRVGSARAGLYYVS